MAPSAPGRFNSWINAMPHAGAGTHHAKTTIATTIQRMYFNPQMGRACTANHAIPRPRTAHTDAATGQVHRDVSSSGIVGNEPPEDSSDVFSLATVLALAGGITTAVTGNTAARLTFGSTEDMIVKRNLFKSLSYSTSDPQARRKLRAAARTQDSPPRVVEVFTAEELGRALGQAARAHVAIAPGGFAERFAMEAARLSGLRGE